MSKTLQQLALDLAAFHNKGEEDVAGRLFRALTGNHRALYELGVVMNKATLQEQMLRMGWKKQWEELTNLEKMELRMAYVMRATADAQGQAAREADNLAGRWRALTGEIRDMATDFGKFLLPPLREALDVMVKLLQATRELRGQGNANQSDQGQLGWWDRMANKAGGDWHLFKTSAPEFMGRRMAYLAGYGDNPVDDSSIYDQHHVRGITPARHAANQAERDERNAKAREARRESDKDAFLGAKFAVIQFADQLRAQARHIHELREKRLDEDDEIVGRVVKDAIRQADEATNRMAEYWQDTRKPQTKSEAAAQFSGLVEFAKAFQEKALSRYEEKMVDLNQRQVETLRAIDTNTKKIADLNLGLA